MVMKFCSSKCCVIVQCSSIAHRREICIRTDDINKTCRIIKRKGRKEIEEIVFRDNKEQVK